MMWARGKPVCMMWARGKALCLPGGMVDRSGWHAPGGSWWAPWQPPWRPPWQPPWQPPSHAPGGAAWAQRHHAGSSPARPPATHMQRDAGMVQLLRDFPGAPQDRPFLLDLIKPEPGSLPASQASIH